MFFIEDEFAISKYYQEIIDKEVLSNSFPWYWQDSSTSYKFPFFSHILVARHNHEIDDMPVNSQCFSFFYDIFKSFCDIHNIAYTKIIRASLNLSYHYSEPHSDPHIDHPFEHKVMIMYLNDVDLGNTIIFDRKFDGVNSTVDKLSDASKKIIPKKGKISCFDGQYYHAGEWPAEGQRRVICVINFI
jgi:hypothetical protein